MSKQSLLQNSPALFLMSFLFLFGCNSGPVEKTATTTSDTVNPAPVGPTPAAATIVSGSLDTLWITAANFKNPDKSKAVFIFYFGDNDTISVDGWKDKAAATPLNTTADVRMLKGQNHPSSPHGARTY